MNGYENFSEVYDFLMADYDYSAILAFILQEAEPKGRRVLDLCAGTGTVAVGLAKEGAQVTAVDIEPKMLTRAAEKAAEAGVRVQLIAADVNHLPVMRPYPLIVSTCDGLNYVKDINAFARRVFLLTAQGGKIVLEFSSLFKAENILKNELFYEVGDDVCWLWQNKYNRAKRTVKQDLTVFKQTNSGVYHRSDDSAIQYFYTNEEICEAFCAAGFKAVQLLRTGDFDRSIASAERLTLTAERAQPVAFDK